MSFFHTLDKFSNNTALVDSFGNQYLYKDLIELSDSFASNLKSGKKNLVLILCRNNIETIKAYLGTIRSGNTAWLLTVDIDPTLKENLINCYRPDYIWQPGPDNNDYVLTEYNIERDFEIYKDLSLLLTTSGSTGSPKLVRLTQKNLNSNAQAIAQYLQLDSSEKPITTLPHHYTYGLSVLNSHLTVGAQVLLTEDSIVTSEFWDFFKREGATSFAGVPYTYETLKKLNFFNMDLPSLRYFTQAGGKLHPDLVKEYAEFSHKKGIKFYVMYGQTEATARISYLPPEHNIEKYASMGIAIPGGTLSVLDDEGKDIKEPFVDGELCYEGENVMLGYATEEKELAEGDKMQGRLLTGDIAHYDEDGYFYITGRKKRFLKIYGQRTNLDELEGSLKRLGIECACGGKDDLLMIACIDSSRNEEIKDLLVEKYHFFHKSFKIVNVDKIERNESGKVQYESVFKNYL